MRSRHHLRESRTDQASILPVQRVTSQLLPDLGAGAIHLIAGRTLDERKLIIRSIGPVWDGNEVWLLAAGGTMFFAFPTLYASSFSGFYLPLMIVLWLLILRGIAIEFRNHIDSPAWTPLWHVVFSGASLLLIVVYGAALGNIVRGVPLDAEGRFFEPLWNDLRVGANAGVLDWYTITVGVAALAVLILHGSLWIYLKTEGALQLRARAIAHYAWIAVGLLTALITALTLWIQPQVRGNLAQHWWGWVFPALAVAGWIGARRFLREETATRAFLSSCAYLIGMLASVAFGIFPYVLPAITDPAHGLTVYNSAAARHMEEQESGSIVNFASINGQSPAALVAAYNVAKAGVIMLTRSLALELAAYGVRVNAVSPGPVYTEFNRKVMAQRCESLGLTEEQMIEKIRSAIPLGRWGEPEDVARVVAFLCGSGSGWMTGEIVRVSGGMVGVAATPPKRPKN